jgi:predicted nucleic acid-binding protein
MYLDASVLLASLLAEPTSAAVFDVIDASPEPILVSEFAAAETASSLSRLVRMKTLTADDAMIRLGDFDVWRARMTDAIEMTDADVRLAVLVTLDRRLATAARALGLSVVQPGHGA